ncbi:hypothetical protein K502DRAFT_325816 [Neoconidiobolus thromboides FSU 785]|nr:hypothetical protein K502DRAFT_325816 [Neoconidiobolus thromboides FSU 785]
MSTRIDPTKSFLKKSKISLIIPRTAQDTEKLLNEPHLYNSINTRKEFFHGENVMLFLIIHSSEQYNVDENLINKNKDNKTNGFLNIKKKESIIPTEDVSFLIKNKFEQLYHFMASKIDEDLNEDKDGTSKNSTTLSHWSLNLENSSEEAIVLPLNKDIDIIDEDDLINGNKNKINQNTFLIYNPQQSSNYHEYFICEDTWACLYKFSIRINSKNIFNRESLSMELEMIIGKPNVPSRRHQFQWRLSSNYFLNYQSSSNSTPTTPNLTLYNSNTNNYYDNGILFGMLNYENILNQYYLIPGIYTKINIIVKPQLKLDLATSYKLNNNEYLIKLNIKNIFKSNKNEILIRNIKLKSNHGQFNNANLNLPLRLNNKEEFNIIYNYNLTVNSNSNIINSDSSILNNNNDNESFNLFTNNFGNNSHEVEVELCVSNYQWNNKPLQIKYKLRLDINNSVVNNSSKVRLINSIINNDTSNTNNNSKVINHYPHSSNTSSEITISSTSSKPVTSSNASIISRLPKNIADYLNTSSNSNISNNHFYLINSNNNPLNNNNNSLLLNNNNHSHNNSIILPPNDILPNLPNSPNQLSLTNYINDNVLISLDLNPNEVKMGESIKLKIMIYNKGSSTRNLTIFVKDEPVLFNENTVCFEPNSVLNEDMEEKEMNKRYHSNWRRKKSYFLSKKKYFSLHQPFLKEDKTKDLNDYYYQRLLKNNSKLFLFNKPIYQLPPIKENNCFQFSLSWLKWHPINFKLPILHIYDRDFNQIYSLGDL